MQNYRESSRESQVHPLGIALAAEEWHHRDSHTAAPQSQFPLTLSPETCATYTLMKGVKIWFPQKDR